MLEQSFHVCRVSYTRGEEEYAVVSWAKEHGLTFYCHPCFNSDGKEAIIFEVDAERLHAVVDHDDMYPIFAWRTVCDHSFLGTAQSEFCKELVRQFGLELPSPEEVKEKGEPNWHWDDDIPF